MNNEPQLLIDEAYEKYHQENKHVMYLTFLLEEEFINKCKTDKEFSEKWGLKIEERELTWDERHELAETKYQIDDVDDVLDKEGIPTKLITITYNDKTIESYESGR
jgi:hypothetical protein